VQAEQWLSNYWHEREGRPVFMHERVLLPSPTTLDSVLNIVKAIQARFPTLRTRYGINRQGVPCQFELSADVVEDAHFELLAAVSDNDGDASTWRYKHETDDQWTVLAEGESHERVQALTVRCRHMVADRSALLQWRQLLVDGLEDRGQNPVEYARPRAVGLQPTHADLPTTFVDQLKRCYQGIPSSTLGEAEDYLYEASCCMPGLGSRLKHCSLMLEVSESAAMKLFVAALLCHTYGVEAVLIANVTLTGRQGAPSLNGRTTNILEPVAVDIKNLTVREACRQVLTSTFQAYEVWETVSLCNSDILARYMHMKNVGACAPVYFNYIGARQQDGPLQYRPAVGVEKIGPDRVDPYSPVFIFESDGDDLLIRIRARSTLLSPSWLEVVKAAVERYLVSINETGGWESIREILAPTQTAAGLPIRVADRWFRPDVVVGQLYQVGVPCDWRVVADHAVRLEFDCLSESMADGITACLHLGASRSVEVCLPEIICAGGVETPTNVSIADVARWAAIDVAVRTVCPDVTIKPEISYVAAGGRCVFIPAIVENLERMGYGGITRQSFSANIPLAIVANSLSPSSAIESEL